MELFLAVRLIPVSPHTEHQSVLTVLPLPQNTPLAIHQCHPVAVGYGPEPVASSLQSE